jgi:hypothetical protein
MAIMSLNMGNLNLEVSSIRNRLAIDEKEKAVLHVELDKERDFQKEYKHNIKICKKNMIKNNHRSKHSYKNCRMKIRRSRQRKFLRNHKLKNW